MEDKHTYGKKMARKGRTKVIYKGTFVSIQTLQTNEFVFTTMIHQFDLFLFFFTFRNLLTFTSSKKKCSEIHLDLTSTSEDFC